MGGRPCRRTCSYARGMSEEMTYGHLGRSVGGIHFDVDTIDANEIQLGPTPQSPMPRRWAHSPTSPTKVRFRWQDSPAPTSNKSVSPTTCSAHGW